MELTVNEVIEKIKNGEINWDNVYNIKIKDKENIQLLEDYANVQELTQTSKKIMINSLKS